MPRQAITVQWHETGAKDWETDPMSYGLVWFKRDLRWQDHAALAQAAARGPVRCIYIVEQHLENTYRC